MDLYEFRKELSTEEAFSDDAESKYEPQFYLTLYQPPCTERVKIWFYKDNGNTAHDQFLLVHILIRFISVLRCILVQKAPATSVAG